MDICHAFWEYVKVMPSIFYVVNNTSSQGRIYRNMMYALVCRMYTFVHRPQIASLFLLNARFLINAEFVKCCIYIGDFRWNREVYGSFSFNLQHLIEGIIFQFKNSLWILSDLIILKKQSHILEFNLQNTCAKLSGESINLCMSMLCKPLRYASILYEKYIFSNCQFLWNFPAAAFHAHTHAITITETIRWKFASTLFF